MSLPSASRYWNSFARDGDLYVVYVVFDSAWRWRCWCFRIELGAIGIARIWWNDGIVRRWFIDLHRIAIEGRIREQCSRALEIHDREKKLVVVLIDARAAPDDLLELGHRVDVLIEHNQMAGLCIHTGGHKLRSRRDHREGGFGIDEVIELGFALVGVAGDAHDVLAVGGRKIRVRVNQCLAHALSVINVFAEHTRFREAVGGFQKLGDSGGDEFSALFENQAASGMPGL